MAGVQAFYDRAADLTATFQQNVSSELYGPQPEQRGVVYLKKGGKMRWDYKAPRPQQVISDGKILWVYQPDDSQVIREDLAANALPSAVAFLAGSGSLSRDFVGSVSRRPDGRLALGLTPKEPSGILDHMTLVIDPKTFRVDESIVYQSDGQTNDIRFDGVRVSTGLKDELFDFTPPRGVEIVDPSKMGTSR